MRTLTRDVLLPGSSGLYAVGGVLLTIVWIAITVLALFHR